MRIQSLSCCFFLLGLLPDGYVHADTLPPIVTGTAVAQHDVKPAIGIHLGSPKFIRMDPGTTADQQLTLIPDVATGELQVTLTPTSGLQWLDSPSQPQIFVVTSNKPIQIPIRLRTEMAGRFYLDVVVHLSSPEETGSRHFRIIVQSGEPQVQRAAQKLIDDPVKILPAQETVKKASKEE